MTNAGYPSVRVGLRLALLTSCMAFAPYATRAQSIQTGVDISVSAEAANNPYLTDEDSSWVGSGTVEVRPWLRRTDETDTIQLRGLVRLRGFTSRYDPETAFGADLTATTRISARTTAYGSANFLTTNRRTPFDVLAPRPGLSDPIVVDPGTFPTPVVVPIADPLIGLPAEDIAVIGESGRITTASIGAGLSHQIDTVSTIGANVNYLRLDGEDDSLGTGYQSASVGANYWRRLSPRTQVGLTGTASVTRYEQNRPRATTLSLSATVAQQFGRYWFLNASAGISRTEADSNGFFPGYSSVAPIFSLNLCNQPVRRKFCLGYTRSQQPSFLGDVRTTDSVIASYSEQFSQSSRADLTASYGRSGGDNNAVTAVRDLELLNIRGQFTRTINDRLEGFAFGSVSKSYGDYLSREPSVSVGVGVRLRLGALR